MGLMNWFKKDRQLSKGLDSEELFKDDVEEHTEILQQNHKARLTDDCSNCRDNELCTLGVHPECNLNTPEFSYLKDVVEEIEIDPNKETIVLLDDNAGVLSFLMDDLKILKKQGLFDYTKYNVLTFDSKFAAFRLRAALYTRQKLNIKFAIFDITIGGTLFTENGENICLDGVDCFMDTSKYYEDLKYIFYTGNKLNTYIKKNQEIVDKFTDYTGDDIENHILYKTSLSRVERQEYLYKFFSGE